jgi:hypothetical protein
MIRLVVELSEESLAYITAAKREHETCEDFLERICNGGYQRMSRFQYVRSPGRDDK